MNEFIDSSIYYSGCFELDTTNAVKKLCKKNMVFEDKNIRLFKSKEEILESLPLESTINVNCINRLAKKCDKCEDN